MSKQKTLKAVASVLGVSTLTLCIGLMNGTSNGIPSNEYKSSSIVTHNLRMADNEINDIKYSQIMNNGSSSSHIFTDEMDPVISVSNNIDDFVEQFILLIQSDRADDESFESSRFIDCQYAENAARCIKIIYILINTLVK